MNKTFFYPLTQVPREISDENNVFNRGKAVHSS